MLNYLGYSWVDQGVNLDDGMKMIRRAVEQRPDDGYIVDSLGWAYYRLGNYEEATKHLERAIELKPEDPTINDHLGDCYWKIGRTLEAQFQWAHARDLKPDPEELKKIEEKLRSGLPDETSRPPPTRPARNPETAADGPCGYDCHLAAAGRDQRPRLAPAKINLTLRVGRQRPDGYHDSKALSYSRATRDALRLAPGSALVARSRWALCPAMRAAETTISSSRPRAALARDIPGLAIGHFELTKNLPAAAGLGGGSSDAAAALRLLARMNDLALDDARLHAAARATGADVPVCLDPRPRIMRGIGDDAVGAARAAAAACRPGQSRRRDCRPGMCSQPSTR